MTDRDKVNNTEEMKVTTCLTPLHTALAVYGCLLDYDSIAAEIKDPQLKALVEKISYNEGIPVVVDPKILSPMDFIHEVIDKRLPDTPRRIATDPSQKVAIRFGETIKSYIAREDLDPASPDSSVSAGDAANAGTIRPTANAPVRSKEPAFFSNCFT